MAGCDIILAYDEGGSSEAAAMVGSGYRFYGDDRKPGLEVWLAFISFLGELRLRTSKRKLKLGCFAELAVHNDARVDVGSRIAERLYNRTENAE